MSTLLYHLHRPTQVKDIIKSYSVKPKVAIEKNMKAYLLDAFKAPKIADLIESRLSILVNNDLNIMLSAPTNKSEDYFYKNTDGDEIIFVHKGTVILRTLLETFSLRKEII